MDRSGITRQIAVLGAGSWGTALAMQLAHNGADTVLWGRDQEQMANMAACRCNARYLPDIPFPAGLSLQASLVEAVEHAADILIAVPSHAFRATLRAIRPHLADEARISWATKGLEPSSRKFLHEIIVEELGGDRRTAVISGPNFAREVALGLPSAVTVASADEPCAQHFASLLHGKAFRAYTSADVIGVEIGGACKNVLAIAAGIADGLGFGANTRAALITRGLAEMMRLGAACGGQRDTLMGLAGLGDLVLTCTDDQSRNRRVGLALGRGSNVEQAVASIGQAVEGVKSAPELHGLAIARGVEMPITDQVFRVLYEGLAPQAAVEALLARDQKPETA